MNLIPERIGHVIRPWARRMPDAPALIEDGRSVSYGALAAAVGALAGQLASWSVRPGDRVVLVGENSAAMVALLLACSERDAWPVLVNARLSAREIDGIREHSGARRVVYATDSSAEAAGHAARHGAQPVSFGALGAGALGPLAADVAPEPVEASGAAQVGALVYTSGTTGAPKAVMLTHRNLLFVAQVSGAMRGLGPASRVYAVLPVSHVFGLASMCLGTLFHGGALRLAARFDPALLLAAIEGEGVTVFQGVPAMFARLVEHLALQGRERVAGHGLRYVSVGGAPLDAALKRRVEAVLGLPLNNGYGLTETSPTIAQTRADDPQADCSNGPLLPGVEARLIGRDGREAGPGGVGELHVRGPGVMKGYYRAPEETARVLSPDGWLNTGDLAQFADGNLTIVGRTKELIIRSGFNVHPPEVEAVLNTHPGVTQSAVVGRRVEGNEEVVAFVQRMPGAEVSVASLQAHAAAHLAPYKRPGVIVILDALPASATGKVLKSALAAIAADLPHADGRREPNAANRGPSIGGHPLMTRIALLLGCAAAALAASSGPLAAAEFRLGVETPLTGNLARVGSAMAEGITVAVELFNAEHKGKHSAKLTVVDDESSPAKAVAAVEQLAPTVQAFSGGYGSNLIGPASETAARLGKVYMTSGGVASGLTQRGLDTFFRINNGEGYSKAMVGMFADRGVKSVAIVYSTKEATAEVANGVAEGLKAKGITVTMHAFDPAITDFKPILHKIKLQDRPEAIGMVGYENDYVGILRAAQVLKPDVKTIAGVWSLATEKMAKEFPALMQNVSGTSTLPFPVDFKDEEAKAMAATYERLYHKVPDYLVLFGYVQTTLLLDAMVRADAAGTLDTPGGLPAELRKTDAQTMIGPVRFDKTGDNPEFSHRMGQHQDGKVVLIWPADAATGPMRFPAVPW